MYICINVLICSHNHRLDELLYYPSCNLSSAVYAYVIFLNFCIEPTDNLELYTRLLIINRFPNTPEVRRSRRLVVSSIATVENYEYGYFWYFYQDGNIEFEVKLTGSLSLGVYPKNESQPAKPKYGTMINDRLYAPIHQHFFNVRLDFAIDHQRIDGHDGRGQETIITNTAQVVDVVQEPEGNPDNEFENAFFAQTTSLTTEKQARMNMCLEKMRTWKVINPNVHNHVGDAVGYKLVPGK